MFGLGRTPVGMQRLVVVVLAFGAAILAGVSSQVPQQPDLVRIAFWVVLTLITQALPVRLPGGVVAHTTTTPLIAAVFDSGIPNPFAVCWIAFLGTIELRDLRRELPWYGTLYNRSAYVISAFSAWGATSLLDNALPRAEPVGALAHIVVAGIGFTGVNTLLAVSVASLRTRQPIRKTWTLGVQNVLVSLVAQVPLGWLMAEVAIKVGLWAALLFMVPLQLARYSFSRYTELRDLFFGSVSALSQAIDAKDGFTRGHADRVSRIGGAIAREMGLSEPEIERIELAALLHDIGKIGVEDRILMKPSRLEQDETELMRRHPIYGASILEPSTALRPLVPMILHHHEHYDGSGYPDGLKADEIPLGSRIILCSDAYEAMTSDRIYRKALGHVRAIETLNKYKSIQFDPNVVRALERVVQKRGVSAFDVSELPHLEYETLAQLRERLADQRLADRQLAAGGE